MSWNYRVTRDQGQQQGDYPVYAIREVYYLRIEGEDRMGWTDPVRLIGDTPDDIKADLELILQDAFDKPVIDITDEDHPKEVT